VNARAAAAIALLNVERRTSALEFDEGDGSSSVWSRGSDFTIGTAKKRWQRSGRERRAHCGSNEHENRENPENA
jgi:hypothetical protein